MLHFLLTAHIVFAAKPIPKAKIYATDTQVVTVDESVEFAIVGNTRPLIRRTDLPAGRSGGDEELRTRIIGNMSASKPDAIILMGDIVVNGKGKTWTKTFETHPALNSNSLLPVMGDFERHGDNDNQTWNKVFPNVGYNIGLNRISTWYSFDVVSKGFKWRMIVLDSDKIGLGARWNEQINWLHSNLMGDYDALMVFMHLPVFDLSGKQLSMNPTGVPLELTELIEDTAPMLKLKAVISAGGHSSQAVLPFEAFGTLFINAGGGGSPADDLRRSATGLTANYKDDVILIPELDEALLKRLDQQAVPDLVKDQAHARNQFSGGFSGVYLASDFPIYGWWGLRLDGGQANFSFHHALLDGKIDSIFDIVYSESDGWQPISPK
ncbi:MAG: hypothetical protein VXZ96_10235 [Myxococcota bacterium]|nr:hypothetical protein [Myxococcota bacterium]